MTQNPITWFKAPVDARRYQLLGILSEVDTAPGIVITIQTPLLDYAPDNGEVGQMQLFHLYPETLISVAVENIPGKQYASLRPDWTEADNKWKTQDSVISVVEDLLSQSTPTPSADNVE